MMSPGIDMVQISRIEKSLKTKGFKERVFGADEIYEQEKRGNNPQGFAACFAAKEAFSKALGTGVVGFALRDVQLLHRENGAPFLQLSGNAKERGGTFSVSISHDGGFAIAIVLRECNT